MNGAVATVHEWDRTIYAFSSHAAENYATTLTWAAVILVTQNERSLRNGPRNLVSMRRSNIRNGRRKR